MEEAQERDMDHELYRAAQVRGAKIPTRVNYHSKTLVGGNNAFHVAAMYGNHEFIALAQLRQYHRQLVCQKNFKGETPLHLAAQFGHDMTVEALVRIHDEVNTGPWEPCWSQIDVNGDTPLHKALRNGHEDIAMLLIDKDVRLVSVDNAAGESLAYLAAENFCNEFLKHILDLPSIHELALSFSGPFGQTVIHSARRLTDAQGKSALHHVKMDADFLKELRTNEAGLLNVLINQVDNKGNTALHIALKNSEQDAALELVRFSGCNWRVRNTKGKSPLDLCKSNDNISVESAVYVLLSDLDRKGVKQKPGKWKKVLSPVRALYCVDLAGIEEEELRKWIDKIAVAAALLIPININSSINVPGGYDSTGRPVLINHTAFNVFYLSNTIGLYANGFILLNCTFGFRKRGNKFLAWINIRLLQVSLIATIFAYLSTVAAITHMVRATAYFFTAVGLLFALQSGYMSHIMARQ